MNITFKVKGIELDAEVSITPYIPAYTVGHPDNWAPAEGGDIEFDSLTCDGKDASFLLKSSFRDELEMAALDTAEAQRKHENRNP